MMHSRIIVTSQGYLPKATNILSINKGVAMRYKYDCCKDTDVLYQNSSQAARYDFSIQKGTSLDIDVAYSDCDRIPMNLTGYSARMKAGCSSGQTFTLNVSISCCKEGLMKIHMSPYETSKIWTACDKIGHIEQYSYQLDLVSPGNEVYRLLEGMIDVVSSAGCRSH